MDVTAVQSFKIFIIQLTGLSRDALHIYAGLATFILVAAITRKSPKSLVPWVSVLAIACGVEALDARDDLHSLGHWRVGASVHDLINTVFWPTVLFLLARQTQVLNR